MSGSEHALEVTRSAVRAMLPSRLYGPLRARRVRRLIQSYTPRVVQHRYAGFLLTIHLQDPLAEGWYDHDWDEPPEISRLRLAGLAFGARVFDIGAHQGVVALILARLVGPDGEVVAVEAERHNALVARDNVAANNAGNVIVLHAAGAAEEGVVSFTESLNGVLAAGRAPGSVEVAAVTVDALAARHGAPDIVLIDVEGHEGHVLDGAQHTIAAGRTTFLFELHDTAALSAAGSTADGAVSHFARERFDVEVALIGPGDGDLLAWRDLEAGDHLRGERCFVIARPRGSFRGFA